jgi:hypothetical protein
MHQRQAHPLQPHDQLGIDPCIVIRLCPAFYHVILFPRPPRDQLLDIARTQVHFNRIECCLISKPGDVHYFAENGGEAEKSCAPIGGTITGDRLKPCVVVEEDDDIRTRRTLLRKAATKTGFVVGDVTKGGRAATQTELKKLAGHQRNRVPKGLAQCPTCGQWRGTCLDPNPEFAGKLMKVSCTCENDNRCAWCGDLLYERKLNANFYNPGDHQVWHVPGFMALKHSCKS